MSRETFVVEQEVCLPDGRRIMAIQSAEAHLVWRSMAKEGLYSKAAAQLRANDTVMDIGGHVGLAAMYFAGAAPGLQIISAEAAPRTHACLRHNLKCHVPGAIDKAASRDHAGDLVEQLDLAHKDAARSQALARDVRTLAQWLGHDVLSLAGPNVAARQEL